VDQSSGRYGRVRRLDVSAQLFGVGECVGTSLIVVAAVGTDTLRNANGISAGIMLLTALAAVGVAILAAVILRGEERCRSFGFAVFCPESDAAMPRLKRRDRPGGETRRGGLFLRTERRCFGIKDRGKSSRNPALYPYTTAPRRG
jgi:hypothetical protein